MEQAQQDIRLIYDQLAIGRKAPKLMLNSWSKKLLTYEGSSQKGQLACRKLSYCSCSSFSSDLCALFKKSIESKDETYTT